MADMNLMALRKFRGRLTLAAYIGVLGIIGAPRERVWANDVSLLETVYATDFIAASVGGLRNSASAGIIVSGLSGTVNKAWLYWHGPMNSTNPLANATLRVNNQTVTGVNIGYSDDNCWGYNNSQAYRADVTSLVRAERNGTYFLSQFVKQGTNINANGASLLIFFDDGNPANNRDVVIFEGNDSNADNYYDAPGWNVSLGGINYTTGRAFLQLHVSDGQIYEDDALVLNGEDVESRGQIFQGTTVPAANNGPGGTGRLWDVVTYEVTDLFAAGANSLALTHGYLGRNRQPKGDCVSLIVAAINLPAGAAPPPPPVNHAPLVTGTPLVTVNSSDPIIVQAEVTDSDGDALACTIAINGTAVTANSFLAESAPATGMLGVTNAFGLGRHSVVFTAHDGAASGTFTTVVQVIDNTPPVIAIENLIVPSDLGRTTAAVDYRSRLSVTDDFPGVTWVADRLPGSAFPIGVTTVNLTAVDASGNRAQRSFTVTVTDSLPPVIQCPLDLLRPTDPGARNAVVRWTCSAVDNLPGCTVTCTPPSGSVFEMGITTVVCAARDTAGNTANCMFTVTVVDREPPVLTVPGDLEVGVEPGQEVALVHFLTTVTDNLPGAGVTCTPPSGSPFPIGDTIVHCIASDAAGNRATGSFKVSVLGPTARDLDPPVITVPENIVVPAGPGRNDAVVSFTVSAADNSASVAVACAPLSGTTFPLGVTTVTCNAIDDAGNVGTGSFTVTVTPSTPPPPPPDHGCIITSRPMLWPANRELIPVSVWLNLAKKKTRFSSARIVSVTSNEPETGLDAEDVGPDWEIVSAEKLKLRLRAERDPNGAGRVYTITVEGWDAKGNLHLCQTTVTVPLEKPVKKKK